jgi:hypothetical protein
MKSRHCLVYAALCIASWEQVGGRVRFTLPDGTQRVVELKAGDAMIRPPVTHLDEALDPVESILVELKH